MKFKALLAILLVASSFVAGAKNPPYPRGPIDELFPTPPQPVEHRYRIDDRTIHYWQIDGGPARVVFLHGTPGDWKAWAHFMADPELQKRATLIAVDRPGTRRRSSNGLTSIRCLRCPATLFTFSAAAAPRPVVLFARPG